MIFSDINGDHLVEGANDIHRLSGANFNLRNIVMTDETGAVVGVQGGTCSLQKSMPVITALKERALLKSQKAGKRILARKAVTKPRPLQKSLGVGLFDTLLHDLNKIRLMRA